MDKYNTPYAKKFVGKCAKRIDLSRSSAQRHRYYPFQMNPLIIQLATLFGYPETAHTLGCIAQEVESIQSQSNTEAISTLLDYLVTFRDSPDDLVENLIQQSKLVALAGMI